MTMKTCPICQIESDESAFFCEKCGYDYLTGVKPRTVSDDELSIYDDQNADSRLEIDSDPSLENEERSSIFTMPKAERFQDEKSDEADEELAVIVPIDLPDEKNSSSLEENCERDDHLGAIDDRHDEQRADSLLVHRVDEGVDNGAPADSSWVYELWIDPEWYRMQQAPDPLPSPGHPRIGLITSDQMVIGRAVPGVHVDLPCGNDSGVSRSHARLSTDGKRWFIEDLGSSNGTYIGKVDEPLPTEPIDQSYELGPHDRIYVGSWTRIVIRPALKQEIV